MFLNNDERGSLLVPYPFMLPSTSPGFQKLWGRQCAMVFYYYYKGQIDAVVNPEYVHI